jgi:hypothetical protein
MRKRGKWLKRIALAFLILVVAGVFVVRQLVPAIIVGQLAAFYTGKVSIASWWLHADSAGIEGLVLHEGSAADSRVWLTVKKIGVDISMRRLFQGRVIPKLVEIDSPAIDLHLDKDGGLLTRIPLNTAGPKSQEKLPRLEVKEAKLTFHQTGRPAMTVEHIAATANPEGKTEVKLSGGASDPNWSDWTLIGSTDARFSKGKVHLAGKNVDATREKVLSIPYAPAFAWACVMPTGNLDVMLDLGWGPGKKNPKTLAVDVAVQVKFDRSHVDVELLGFSADQVTGRLFYSNKIVKLENAKGKALGGAVSVHGAMDFREVIDTYDLDLAVDGIDITRAPRKWNIPATGLSGSLSATCALDLALGPEFADLRGTTAKGTIRNPKLQGIPIDSIVFTLDTGKPPAVDSAKNVLMRGFKSILSRDHRSALVDAFIGPLELATVDGLIAIDADDPPAAGAKRENRSNSKGENAQPAAIIEDESKSGATAEPSEETPRGERKKSAATVIEATRSTPNAAGDEKAAASAVGAAKPNAGTIGAGAEPRNASGYVFQIPRSISTRLKLGKIDVEISLDPSMAKVPLVGNTNFRQLKFQGRAGIDLTRIADIEIGDLAARFGLEDGVASIGRFEGRVLDPPGGEPGVDRPRIKEAFPVSGPPPPGAFRGSLRAEIDPERDLIAQLETNLVPLGDIVARFLPEPTPFSARVTIDARARAPMTALGDPSRWTIDGSTSSPRVVYRTTEFEGVASEWSLKADHVIINYVKANLRNQPFSASGDMGLSGERRFTASVEATEWPIADLIAMAGRSTSTTKFSGSVSAKTNANGTITPLTYALDGAGKVDRLEVGGEKLGDVKIDWKTQNGKILVKANEAALFGGKFGFEALVPTNASGDVDGKADIKNVDLADLANRLFDGAVELGGAADGDLTFHFGPLDAPDLAKARGDLNLTAPGLKVENVSVDRFRAALDVKNGKVFYTLKAVSGGGTIELSGDAPLDLKKKPKGRELIAATKARVRDIRIDDIGRQLGYLSDDTRLRGLGDFDLNLDAPENDSNRIVAKGSAQLRSLILEPFMNIGELKGNLLYTSKRWSMSPISGVVVGGAVSGRVESEAQKTGPPIVRYDLKLADFELKEAFAAVPQLAALFHGSGTARLNGEFVRDVEATAQLFVPRATFYSLPLMNTQASATIDYSPIRRSGEVRVTQWKSRLAGGHVDARMLARMGNNNSFNFGMTFSQVDLETITHILLPSGTTATGKLNGEMRLEGPSFEHLSKLRGKILVDLDDASLLNLPVLGDVAKFLGIGKGSVFQDGDLAATIADNRLSIDRFTLVGKILQLHSRGTIDRKGHLNLKVVVNMSELISAPAQLVMTFLPSRRGAGYVRMRDFLSNQLIKIRVTGTIQSPNIARDSSIELDEDQTGFFADFLRPAAQ